MNTSAEDYQQRIQYYKKEGGLYPFSLIFKMLTLDGNRKSESTIISPGSNRVIGLQYDAEPYYAHDFSRYSENNFRVTTLKKTPFGLHMGMHQSADNSVQLLVTKKELVFDIDITDYTRFCPCKDLKRLCSSCWFHIEGSYLILKYILTQQMGYSEKELLWVFSGSKGIHCFVNSKRALSLSAPERLVLKQVMTIQKTDDTKLKAFMQSIRDPAFLRQIGDFFNEKVIKKRDLFQYEAFEKFCVSVLKLHYNSIASLVENAWKRIDACQLEEQQGQKAQRTNNSSSSSPSKSSESVSAKKWRTILSLEKTQNQSMTKNQPLPSHFIAFKLLYPQIDPQPLIMKHLIKLPFSIHSKTTNIALPIEEKSIIDCDPTNAFISLSQLLENPEAPLFLRSIEILEKWVEAYPSLAGLIK
jgi:DNA primase catalytic subunit